MPKQQHVDTMPLYPDEKRLAAEILPTDRVKEWDGIAAVLERRGLPGIDPLFGGRYWPAVRAFLDRRHGLSELKPATKPDGEENWDAPQPRPRAIRPRS